MRQLTIEEPTDAAWKKWRSRCAEATAEAVALVAGGDRFEVSALYKEQKEVFLKLFNEKCAYCERSIANQRGDLDHYRPKGQFKGLDGNIVKRVKNGTSQFHRGYYWLAYEWTNILLACISCNQAMRGRGKHNHFPVKGEHAWLPGEEQAEHPLLLNPLKDDPVKHWSLNKGSGMFDPETDEARATIRILGLNSQKLAKARAKEFKRAEMEAFCLIGEARTRGEDAINSELRAMLEDEDDEFTSVKRLALVSVAWRVQSVVGGLTQ